MARRLESLDRPFFRNNQPFVFVFVAAVNYAQVDLDDINVSTKKIKDVHGKLGLRSNLRNV